ncbi:MAG: sigma-70 family RNA polymerase sigma factor [Planctomycetes bacterium]|nr:sigma-70 family RNA polymerase sigma factor [Planctomycetota bacterium]
MESPNEISTTTLVARAQEGDRTSFDELVRRYSSRLEKQIQARLGARLKAKLDVQDVLQETFTVAFRSIKKFIWHEEDSFYRWLAGISEHYIMNASQKKAWNEISLAREVAVSDVSPSKALRREERFERLEAALAGLSDEHRRVVILARIDGLTVTEIAARMDRSTGAVKMLLARALLSLKKSFGDTESFNLPDQSLNGGGMDRDG